MQGITRHPAATQTAGNAFWHLVGRKDDQDAGAFRERGRTKMSGKEMFWDHRTTGTLSVGVVISRNGKTIPKPVGIDKMQPGDIGLAARIVDARCDGMTEIQSQVAEDVLTSMYRRLRTELGLSTAGYQPGTVVDVQMISHPDHTIPGHVIEDTGHQLRLISVDETGKSRLVTLPLGHVVVNEVAFSGDQYTTGSSGLIQHLLDRYEGRKPEGLTTGQVLKSAEVGIDFYCYLLDQPVGEASPDKFHRLASAIVARCKDPEHLARIVQHEHLISCGYDTHRKDALIKIRDLKVLAGLFKGSGTWIKDELFQWMSLKLSESSLPKEQKVAWLETLFCGLVDHLDQVSLMLFCDILTDLIVFDEENEQALQVFKKLLTQASSLGEQLEACMNVLHNTVDDCRQRFFEAALEILPERINPGDGEVRTRDELAQYA
jgi:hypothetical protein